MSVVFVKYKSVWISGEIKLSVTKNNRKMVNSDINLIAMKEKYTAYSMFSTKVEKKKHLVGQRHSVISSQCKSWYERDDKGHTEYAQKLKSNKSISAPHLLAMRQYKSLTDELFISSDHFFEARSNQYDATGKNLLE